MADVFTDTRTQAAQTTTASVPGVEYVRAYRFAEHGGGAVTDVFDCGNGGVFFSLAEGLSSGPETVSSTPQRSSAQSAPTPFL